MTVWEQVRAVVDALGVGWLGASAALALATLLIWMFPPRRK